MASAPSPKLIVDGLRNATSVESLLLDTSKSSGFQKELRQAVSSEDQSSQVAREWAASLVKSEIGQSLSSTMSTASSPLPTSRVHLQDLRERIGSIAFDESLTSSSNKPVEDISRICEDWIATPQSAEALDAFSQLQKDAIAAAAQTKLAKTDSQVLRALSSLPRVLTKDKGSSYALKRDLFDLLKHVDSPTSLDAATLSPTRFASELQILNEALVKHRKEFDAVHGKDVSAAWYPARTVVAALAEAETTQHGVFSDQLGRLNTAYTRKHAVQLRSFDAYWTAKTERWTSKKKGKKNPAVDEATIKDVDEVFEAYLKGLEAAADAHWDEVMQPCASSLRTALDAFVAKVKSVIDEPDLVNRYDDLPKIRQYLAGIDGTFEAFLGTCTSANEQVRSDLRCTLDDLRSEYRLGSETVLGRLERCNNKAFKKRIQDVETSQQRQRVTSGSQLSGIALTRKLRVVCLNIILPCLKVGEQLEKEALDRHVNNLRADPILKVLADTRRRLTQEHEAGVTTGQIELGRCVARVLLKEAVRALADLKWQKLDKSAQRDFEAAKHIAAASNPVSANVQTKDATPDTVEGESGAKKKNKKKKKAFKKASDGVLDSKDSLNEDVSAVPSVGHSEHETTPATEIEHARIDDLAAHEDDLATTKDHAPNSAMNEKPEMTFLPDMSVRDSTPPTASPRLYVAPGRIPTPIKATAPNGVGGPPGLHSAGSLPSPSIESHGFQNGGQQQSFPYANHGIPMQQPYPKLPGFPMGPPGVGLGGLVMAPAGHEASEVAALRAENIDLCIELQRMRQDLYAVQGQLQAANHQIERLSDQRVASLPASPAPGFPANGSMRQQQQQASFSRAPGLGRPAGSSSPSPSTGSPQVHHHHQHHPNGGDVASRKWRRTGSHLRCANCGGDAHASRDCSEVCRACDVPGHVLDACPGVGSTGVLAST
ncbi:hypothetical protein HKX48_009094 [Thoreauomyces humboldtii]|nr:hypothetical protein HKX48_009094 [Thoreauomyces humboldtii]